jgi:hypothetical protein
VPPLPVTSGAESNTYFHVAAGTGMVQAILMSNFE